MPVPVQEQIETLVEQRLAETPDATQFGIHFGPTEVTTTPDEETIQWIDWAGRKALEIRPDIPVIINDHISGGQPVEHFDNLGCPPGTNDAGVCDYYDLAFHTDPRLGVSVHTVMFYPLEGPAPVYDFAEVTTTALTMIGDGGFETAPVDAKMELVGLTGPQGDPRFIRLADIRFLGTLDAAGFGDRVVVDGKIVVSDVVDLLVQLIGFDEQRALAFLAGVYGVPVEELPAEAPFRGDIALGMAG